MTYSVYDYFLQYFEVAPADESLRDLPCDSNCGDDCVASIMAVYAAMAVADKSTHGALIAACERDLSVKWHG